ncbi:MAG: ribosomal protein S18-alanine N-acetyltransferase [Parvularculaceae bacterium]
MNADWRVRPATRADADVLASLEKAAFGAASWGAENVKDGLTAPYVSGLLAVDESDKAAGFALWRTLGREAEILTIGASPSYRKRGVAAALLAALLEDAAAQGCAAMFLEVDSGNAAARALYEKFGFETVGERRAYYRNGADALVLRRYL